MSATERLLDETDGRIEADFWYRPKRSWFPQVLWHCLTFFLGALSCYILLAQGFPQPTGLCETSVDSNRAFIADGVPSRASQEMQDYWSVTRSRSQTNRFVGDPDANSPFKGPPSKQVEERWSDYFSGWSTWIYTNRGMGIKALITLCYLDWAFGLTVEELSQVADINDPNLAIYQDEQTGETLYLVESEGK